MKTPIRKVIEDLETILALLEAHEHPRFRTDTVTEPRESEMMSHVLELASNQVRVIGGLTNGKKQRTACDLRSGRKTRRMPETLSTGPFEHRDR